MPKRKEWLNYFSKGFIVQSINNGCKNEKIKFKKNNEKLQIKADIIPINLTTIILNEEIQSNKNKSYINNSNLSSTKTSYSLLINDEEDKNKLCVSSNSNIKDILTERNNKYLNNNIKEKINKKINFTDKKAIKKNKFGSVKNIKYIQQYEKKQIKEKRINYYNKKNGHKSIKMNSKIKLKKEINSPLLNYLDYIKKNENNDILNLTNNKNNNKNLNKQDNSINNSNSKIKLNLSINKENNNNKSKSKKYKYKYSKSIKEIKINNLNVIELQKYMLEGRKFKNNNNSYIYNGYNNDYKGEIGDYSFDDEEEKISLTDRKNIITFSDICSPINNYTTSNKNELNELFEIMKKKRK